MVQAVRSGRSLRAVARSFAVSLSTVAYWVDRAHGRRLDRVQFANRVPGRAWNRTAPAVEQRILQLRRVLRSDSVLGEYGPDAIGAALHEAAHPGAVPTRATIHRVLERYGVLDGVRQPRRPAPAKGWYLPAVARAEAELDSFDFIEDLKIADGPLVSVLTGTSLHGALAEAWIMERCNARVTLAALQAHWRKHGLPTYAQFDNDTIFQGAHQFANSVGRISRLCLALQVIPVFAPPREPGFQNAIEGFNALWLSKVWQRHQCPDVPALASVSARYIAAYRDKTAVRRDRAPARRRFPVRFRLDLNVPLRGMMIFVRRSNEHGRVQVLGNSFLVDAQWCHRLVRCNVDFIHQQIRFHALRRRDPDHQPMLRELSYPRPNKPFKDRP